MLVCLIAQAVYPGGQVGLDSDATVLQTARNTVGQLTAAWHEAMADPVYRFDPKVANAGGSTFNEQVAEVRNVSVPDGSEPDKLLEGMCR